MNLKNKEENILGKRRKPSNPEKKVTGIFVHKEKKLYLDGTLDDLPNGGVIQETLMTISPQFILGETSHGDILSLEYYNNATSFTLSFGEKGRNQTTTLEIKSVFKNIHVESLENLLLEKVVLKVSNIDTFFHIIPGEQKNKTLGNPGEINIDTIGKTIDLYRDKELLINLEYYYDRFSLEKTISINLFSCVECGISFNIFTEKICRLVKFIQFAIEDDVYINEIVLFKKVMASPPIYTNIFNNKYFFQNSYKKGIFEGGKEDKILLKNDNIENIKEQIKNWFILSDKIGYIFSSYLFYTGAIKIGLQDYFLGLIRIMESLHRIMINTKAVDDNKSKLKTIIEFIEGQDNFSKKDKQHYQKNIKGILQHNEISLSEKLLEIKEYYRIGDDIITEKEIKECVALRIGLTHKDNSDIENKKEFNLSRKMYYFARRSLRFLIDNLNNDK